MCCKSVLTHRAADTRLIMVMIVFVVIIIIIRVRVKDMEGSECECGRDSVLYENEIGL